MAVGGGAPLIKKTLNGIQSVPANNRQKLRFTGGEDGRKKRSMPGKEILLTIK